MGGNVLSALWLSFFAYVTTRERADVEYKAAPHVCLFWE